MRQRRRTIGLMEFLRGHSDPAAGLPGCCHYDQHHGGCLYEDGCRVERGQRYCDTCSERRRRQSYRRARQKTRK